MSYKKHKKFNKMKQKLWAGASGGLLAGVMFFGAGTAFADAIPDHKANQYQEITSKSSGMHMMRRWNSIPKIGTLVSQLGLDVNNVKEELKSGKQLKQILQENGIDMGELYKAFG